ncbi:MAG: RNA methyltransferase [Alistipes sp.]
MTKSEIQLVRSLADKRSRSATGLFVAEGEKLVGELRDSSLHVERIFALQGVFYGAEVEVVSPKEMERISLLKTPSSALALVTMPTYELQPQRLTKALVLALDNIQNPGNMGTIIRLADWFGITDVVCSRDTADCFNPKVVQATMGAILRVRVHYVDLEAFLAESAAQKIPIYGTFLEGENIFHTTLSTAGVIVMGNEGQGVSHNVERLITRKLFIPPYPADRQGSESLNVAMATGIICAQFRSR